MKHGFCLVAWCFLASNCFGQKPVAELPRAYIDTTWHEPSGGTKRAVHTAEQFSKALADSAPGDVIILDAGATYTGNFQLPAKDNPEGKWIFIISSNLAKLPEGKRVSPDDAANMAKIVSPNATAPMLVSSGAHHWRLAGLELTAQSNYPSGCPGNGQNCMTYFIINIKGLSGPAADYVWIDRCYGHGSPTQDFQGGVIMNWNHAALIDSYIDDVHIKGFDSVGAGGYHTVGPIKIVNNYISSSTENIMFGGSGGNGNPGVPSDIEIRNNHLFKPLAWAAPGIGCCGKQSMVVKNAFEVKSGQRILFDGNLIENVWAGGQLGFAIVLTVRSGQSGDMAVDNDITITNNVLKNVVSGIGVGAADDTCGWPQKDGSVLYSNCRNAGSQSRWNIANNLILFYDPKLPGGNRNLGIGFSGGYDRINGRPGVVHDVVFQHNTMIPASNESCWNSIYFSTSGQNPPFTDLTKNVWILDNVLCRPPTGDHGLQGTAGLTQYMGNPEPLGPRFAGNVIFVPSGDRAQSFPPHNLATQKAPTFDSQYQLTGQTWTADSTDKKPAGFIATGTPLQQMTSTPARK